jgi:hypothetical protein
MSKPYQERSDLEKIQKQWHKLTGLHTREEWSAAIVRAATAAELAANFVIRTEFKARSQFDSEFVDSLLKWANGLAGKTEKLLLPLTAGSERHKAIKKLNMKSRDLNSKRHAIAHQGEFCNENESKAKIQTAREFIEALVQLYEPQFKLKDQRTKK